MKKWSTVALLACITTFVAFVSIVTAQEAQVIPDIENWERVLHTEAIPNSNGPLFMKLYGDRHGNYGIVGLYRNLQTNALVPFMKVWGFEETVDLRNSFGALLLTNGTWVMGSKDEQIIPTMVAIDEGVSITFGFNGEHSWASRKIIIGLAEFDDVIAD